MKSLREQLKPVRSQVESNRIFQQLGTLRTSQLRKMLTDPSKHVRPHRTRIYAELLRRKQTA